MSYILDALNKSEEERKGKQLPGLQELAGESTGFRPGVRQILTGLLILIVVNTVGVYLFFGDRFSDAKSDGSELVLPQAPVILVEPSTGPAPTLVPAIPAGAEQPPADIAAPGKAESSSPFLFPGISPDPVSISDLPADVRARLPVLNVTAHIYASDAEFRMVKIDGTARAEGELIGPGHRIREITETGLILDFEDYAYVLDIVEDWQTGS